MTSASSTTAEAVRINASAGAAAFQGLLKVGQATAGKPASSAQKQEALALSKTIAQSLAALSQAAQALKGDDWVDPSDPNVQAEQELLAAAAAIDAAAKKLAQLEARPSTATADSDLPFEGQIVHATTAIASATSALVRAASAAQRELIEAGAVATPADGEAYSEEAALSASLVSAAKNVAQATKSLCEAANATAEGSNAGEKLVASAKAVAKSTAQLMIACKVKGNAGGAAMRRLQAAGSAVKKSADNLVRAAQEMYGEMEDEDIAIEERRVKGIRQEIEAVEVIVKQERELEMAKRALAKIRATKYGKGANSVEWAGSLRLK
jgi:talin